jgi:hypothetical protein
MNKEDIKTYGTSTVYLEGWYTPDDLQQVIRQFVELNAANQRSLTLLAEPVQEKARRARDCAAAIRARSKT